MFSAAIFLPLLASIIAGLFGRFIGDRGAERFELRGRRVPGEDDSSAIPVR